MANNSGKNPLSADGEELTADNLFARELESRELVSQQLASMLIEELREQAALIHQLLEAGTKLQSLNRKPGWSTSLEVANLDPSASKCQTVFKPAPHTALYKTVDYSIYRQFISRIESTATETVAYVILGLGYTEKELWNAHIEDRSGGQIWQEMADFLLL